MRMTRKNERYNIAYKILSEASARAYEDLFLLSNQVLSKNPLTNNFLRNFVFRREVCAYRISAITIRIVEYYLRSFLHFAIYMLNVIIFRIKAPRDTLPGNLDHLIILNIFMVIDRIKKTNRFEDIYLPGLEIVLRKMNRQFIYVPVFDRYGMRANHGSVLSILKNQEIPILYEYQLLRTVDLLYVFYFIVFYPLHVLRYAGSLPKDKYETNLVKHELINTLGQVTFYNFSRYLVGRRISQLPYRKIKVIGWFENQAGEKNFYKGLRSKPEKVAIYGAQLLPYAEMDLNIIVDENEKRFGVIPDKILVNGPFYVPKETKLNYAVGPSLRYGSIFKKKFSRNLRKHILVLLPYSSEYAEAILRVLHGTSINERNVIIKTHPASMPSDYRQFLKSNYTLVDNENVYELFAKSELVIGAASGGLLEAASMGIPAIVIKSSNMLDYDMLPEYGKGIIWEEVYGAEDLQRAIAIIEARICKEVDEIDRISREYRDSFFLEPTEGNILRTFDL